MQKSNPLTTFRTATWLGWQIESNWTDPLLFAIYSIVKPLAGAAIIVVMYSVITQGAFSNPLFSYMYIGNSFYMYVAAVMTGISWAVLDDREHYKTLKYIYIAPVEVPVYLLGRGVARFVTTSVGVIITLAVGMLFFHLPVDLATVNWPLFILTLLIGVIMLAMIGLLLAGITLLTARHEGFIGDAAAGALYIFSGAIFPLDILPAAIRPIGYFMPTTYWLELLRRAMVSNIANTFPTLAQFDNLQLLGILVLLSIVFGLLSMGIAAPFVLVQHSFRRILAYSSIDHCGIMVLGLGFGGPLGVLGMLLHMTFHSVTKPLLFFCAGNIQQHLKTDQFRKAKEGLIHAMPISSALFLMTTLAVTGSPPFSLFQSEFTILRAAFAGRHFVPAVLFVAFLVAIFTGFLIHISRLVLGPDPGVPNSEHSAWKKYSLVGLACIVLVMGFWVPAPLYALIQGAAQVVTNVR